jgi:hypothetical protein
VNQINEHRNPRTNATLDQLLERYLSQFQGSANPLQLYQTHVKNHIRPMLGQVKIGRLDAEVLDSFYAELRRCRKHCARKRGLEAARIDVLIMVGGWVGCPSGRGSRPGGSGHAR